MTNGRHLAVVGTALTLLVLLPVAKGATQEPPPTESPSTAPTPLPITPEPTPAPTSVASEPPTPGQAAVATPVASAAASPSASPYAAPRQSVPYVERTKPRNTVELVQAIEPLAEWGMTRDQALLEGMGRFPVAGVAYYRDDWLAARYEPTFHLHRGLDVFADFGTSVRAPTAGVVTKFSDAYPGGITVTMQDNEDTVYYFAHLMGRAETLEVGQSVEVGTLLGYVGDSGNAEGGAPHLHLEIRRGGTIRPKPIVDAWLDEAEDAVGDWLEQKRLEIEQQREDVTATFSPDLLQVLLEPTV